MTSLNDVGEGGNLVGATSMWQSMGSGGFGRVVGRASLFCMARYDLLALLLLLSLLCFHIRGLNLIT